MSLISLLQRLSIEPINLESFLTEYLSQAIKKLFRGVGSIHKEHNN